jgi:hypothetical protein
MANLPSVKTLTQVFGENAKLARKTLEMTDQGLRQIIEAQDLLRECFNLPATEHVRMHVLNKLAETHGVESVEVCVERRYGDPDNYAEFLNTGEMYAATLILYRGRYRVQDLGTFLERNSK